MGLITDVIRRPNRFGRTQRRKRSRYQKLRARWGWLFISPWIFGFFAFLLIPMIASLAFTFLDFNILEPDETTFIGLRNWRKLGTDPQLREALRVTIVFMLIALPVSIVQPIAMAALLNAKALKFKPIFTTLFYMPYVIPLISTIYIWTGVMNTQTGWIARTLGLFGIDMPDILNEPSWIPMALILIGLWGAGNAMLLTLAAMQNIPTSLYDAARVDGAGSLRIFFSITIPLITPVIFYNLVLALIGIFQIFTVPWILSNGGDKNPDNAYLFYNVHFYKTGFRFQEMGYAATLAWLLFGIVITLTIAIFWSSRYWVYQPGGTDE